MDGTRPLARRRRVGVAAGALLLAASGAIALAWTWWPWERPQRPLPGSAAAALLLDPAYDAAAWVPYPAQNLAGLAAPAGREAIAAACRLLDIAPPRLPGFGPFALPPARELAIATDRRGERTAVRARMGPLLGRVARLAGWVAGNPWLAGGEVSAGGRRLRVDWEGTLWTVTGGGASATGAAPPGGGSLEPALAYVRLGPPPRSGAAGGAPPPAGPEEAAGIPLPAGLYRVRREGGDLTLGPSGGDRVRGTAPGPRPQADVAGEGGPPATPLLAPATAFVQLASGASGPQAVAVFAAGGPLPGLPAFAVLAPGRLPAGALPGTTVLAALGLAPATARRDGWSLAAWDRASLERAGELPARLAPWIRPPAPPRLALWIDLQVSRPLAARLGDLLGSLGPLAAPAAERARAAALLLEGLGGYRRAEVLVPATGPARMALRR